jgi:hypothetical protein
MSGTRKAMREARKVILGLMHAGFTDAECDEAIDAFEDAVRADEKRRIMDNDIASANMGRIE